MSIYVTYFVEWRGSLLLLIGGILNCCTLALHTYVS